MPKITSKDHEPKNNSEKGKIIDFIFAFFIISLIISVTIFLHHISMK